MNRSRAFFVAIEPYATQASHLPWSVHLSPSVVGVIADHAALGFRVIAVLNARSFGVESDHDINVLGQAVCNGIARATGVNAVGVVVLDSGSDPRPMWEAARRFDLDLRQSLLLTEGGVHAGIALTAGVPQAVSLGEVGSVFAAA